jgi:hypothetical protein
MSPLPALARMISAPVSAGRMPSRAGDIASIITRTITTGTGTRSGRSVVRS